VIAFELIAIAGNRTIAVGDHNSAIRFEFLTASDTMGVETNCSGINTRIPFEASILAAASMNISPPKRQS